MPALITSSDACYQLATDNGFGMLSWWTLSGMADTYTGSIPNTDGYQITFSMQWRDMSGEDRTTGAAVPFTAGENAAVGTCIETRDDDGNVLAAGTSTEGNFAICHWFYLQVGGNTSGTTATGVVGTEYSETRYYTET